MSRLRVVTWNAEGMFVEGTKTRRATPHKALSVLKRLNADIVVIPEFGVINKLEERVSVAIRALGYTVNLMPYDDPRAPGLGLAVLSRLPVEATHIHQLGKAGRKFFEVVCRDDDNRRLHIVGVHLDDRTESLRMEQVATVVEVINQHSIDRVVALGDFNAMHENAWFARFARSRTAGVGTKLVRHPLIVSMAERVQEMAAGTTVEYLLAHTSLHDLDTGRKRTISAKQAGLEWMPAVRLAKIDWMFGSKHFSTVDYRVLNDVGSDHRPVIATLDYA
jgi:endonuclease/exonuclease/phosphatase family metal-dependent hydrolase